MRFHPGVKLPLSMVKKRLYVVMRSRGEFQTEVILCLVLNTWQNFTQELILYDFNV